MFILLTYFKVSVCRIFITIHLHVSDVSFLWRCRWVHLDKSVSDWLSPWPLSEHHHGNNDDDKHCNATNRYANNVPSTVVGDGIHGTEALLQKWTYNNMSMLPCHFIEYTDEWETHAQNKWRNGHSRLITLKYHLKYWLQLSAAAPEVIQVSGTDKEVFCDGDNFAYFSIKMCCRYSLESPQRSDSNEYPQHIFLWRTTTHVFMHG